MPSRERKEAYFTQMQELISEYKNILVVHADHVGSLQFQKIRQGLRGSAVVLMGKNTMMRRCIAMYLQENKDHPIENILPLIVGNIGFIFTNGDLGDIRTVIDQNTVPAAAKVGVIAESDVIVPPGATGCDPGQTSWFQALNVPTKISKGQIEIISELKLITKGQKVGGSEAALLQKLDIRPFTYGLILVAVYNNGAVFDAKVLDLTDDDLKTKFLESVRRIAALSLATGIPTLASLPHIVGGALKTMIAISGMVGYSFEAMAEWNELLSPAAAAPAAEEAAAEE